MESSISVSVETLLPELTRCILRASSYDGYKQIIDHLPGTFSLQEFIASDYKVLYVDQVLPATDSYPELTVVDLLPTTRALVPQNVSTFIVLAPEATMETEDINTTSHQQSEHESENVNGNIETVDINRSNVQSYKCRELEFSNEINEERIVVQLCDNIERHLCFANQEFMKCIVCLSDSDNESNVDDQQFTVMSDNIIEKNESNYNGSKAHTIIMHSLTNNNSIEESYLIGIGEEKRRFVFNVFPVREVCDMHDDDNADEYSNKKERLCKEEKDRSMRLYAGADVFRNIRAACLRDIRYQSQTAVYNKNLEWQTLHIYTSASSQESLTNCSSLPQALTLSSLATTSPAAKCDNIFFSQIFAFPSDMCNLVLATESNTTLQFTPIVIAQKVSLCSAIDNFIMTNIYGENYADLLATVMLHCASQLHGKIVNVGDVITLHLHLSKENITCKLTEGEQIAEVLTKTLEHHSDSGDAVWPDSAEQSESTELIFPLRVTEVIPFSEVNKDHERNAQNNTNHINNNNNNNSLFGVINLPLVARDQNLDFKNVNVSNNINRNNNSNNNNNNSNTNSRSPTEIRLVSQSSSSNMFDITPLFVNSKPRSNQIEIQIEKLDALEIVQSLKLTICNYFSLSLYSHDTYACRTTPLVLVLHGIRENLGHEFVHHVLSQVGVPAAVASTEGLSDDELESLLRKFSSHCHAPAGLIIHHAERLDEEYSHLLSLLHFSNMTSATTTTKALTKNVDTNTNSSCANFMSSEVDNENQNVCSVNGLKIIVLLCETVDAVAPALAACATNVSGVIKCSNPSENDRINFLTYHLNRLCTKHNIWQSMLLSASSLAAWTVGLTFSDLRAFACECVCEVAQRWKMPHMNVIATPNNVNVTTCNSSENHNVRNVHLQDEKNNCVSNDVISNVDNSKWCIGVLSEIDCEACLQTFMRAHGHNLVSTKLQPVRWSDVGGLDDAKRELRETIQLPLLYPELFNTGMKKRSGILFYGPPGCGKTLLAKAVATEMNMNFMSVKGPELINQYVGESEKNIRLLFQRARDNSPCIVFFDELDALVPARGAKGDGGGAMDRIVAQLLVEVDGVGQSRSDGTQSGDIFIIGATNRPDLLDPSLLRPGRFDRLCYLGIPSTRKEQMYALRALTRKFKMRSDVDFDELLSPLECVYTGADFFALCSDAMMFAVEEVLNVMRESTLSSTEAPFCNGDTEHSENFELSGNSDDTRELQSHNEDECIIEVSMEHFLKARDQLKSSVTREDLKRYEAMRTKYSTS